MIDLAESVTNRLYLFFNGSLILLDSSLKYYRQCRNVVICHSSTTCWHLFNEFQDTKFCWRNTSKSYQMIRLTEPILKVSRFFIPITSPPIENWSRSTFHNGWDWVGFFILLNFFLEFSNSLQRYTYMP